MSELRVSVVPVGRVDTAELEAALARVSKVLGRPIELREPAQLPRASEDVARGQHDAKRLLGLLRPELARLKVKALVGASASGSPVPIPNPDAAVFVTDVDLFVPAADAVLGEVDAAHHAALLSVRRLREAFYRRKADPARQRARLAKEILRDVGRILGVPECRDPSCAMGQTVALADIDRKSEKYCAACWRRLSSGSFRV